MISVDLIITTSTSDRECVSEAEDQMLNPKRRTTQVWFIQGEKERDVRNEGKYNGRVHLIRGVAAWHSGNEALAMRYNGSEALVVSNEIQR